MFRFHDTIYRSLPILAAIVLLLSMILSGCLGDPDSPGIYGSSLQSAVMAGLISGEDLKRSVTEALWTQLGDEFVSRDVLMAGGRAQPFEALSLTVKINVVSAMVRNVLNGDIIELDMEAFFDPETTTFTSGSIINWKILEKGSAVLTVTAVPVEDAGDFTEAGPNDAFVRPFVSPGGGYLCMDAVSTRISLSVKQFGSKEIVFEGKEIPLGSHYLTVSCKGLISKSVGFSVSGSAGEVKVILEAE